jgi:penicillin-binding protein 2
MAKARSEPLFGPAGEARPQPGRPTIKRDEGGSERWIEAILPADAEAGTLETTTSRRPLLLVVAMVALVAVGLSAQLFRLQISNGQHNLGLAEGNRLRERITHAPRGVIYDRNKAPLAENLASFDITVVPSLLPRDTPTRQAIYQKISTLTGVDVATITAKTEGDCESAAIAQKHRAAEAQTECLLQTQPQLIASNLPRDTALAFDQASATIPGFSLDVNPIRQYLDGGALSVILGYTGRVSPADLTADNSYLPTDLIGKTGLERQYENILRGQNGSEQTEVDASGHPVKLLGAKTAVPGDNLVLTIDTALQKTLSDAITKQMQASGAQRAAGVALNPSTGEVLAAVNLPTFDDNLFARGIGSNDYSALVKNPGQPLFNKAFAGGYPTGSIIKPLIGSAALQEHAVSPYTTVNDTGSITVTNKYDPNIKYTYRSYDPGGLGIVNITKAIAVSSDVFFYTVGGGFGDIAGLGVDKLTAYYHKFGLGQKPGIDVPEQTAGRVPTPDWKQKLSGQPWSLGDTYNISIGQGDLLASPLQMAVAEAAVANGGKVVKPHLLREVQSPAGQTLQSVQPQVEAQGFVSPDNLNIIRNAMHDVVYASYGTACCKIAAEVPVQVAAKTGTAETVASDTGDKNQSKPDAWFTAFAPYDNPQIEIVVMIEHSGEGAQFAAPAVRDTLSWCFNQPGGTCLH